MFHPHLPKKNCYLFLQDKSFYSKRQYLNKLKVMTQEVDTNLELSLIIICKQIWKHYPETPRISLLFFGYRVNVFLISVEVGMVIITTLKAMQSKENDLCTLWHKKPITIIPCRHLQMHGLYPKTSFPKRPLDNVKVCFPDKLMRFYLNNRYKCYWRELLITKTLSNPLTFSQLQRKIFLEKY